MDSDDSDYEPDDSVPLAARISGAVEAVMNLEAAQHSIKQWCAVHGRPTPDTREIVVFDRAGQFLARGKRDGFGYLDPVRYYVLDAAWPAGPVERPELTIEQYERRCVKVQDWTDLHGKPAAYHAVLFDWCTGDFVAQGDEREIKQDFDVRKYVYVTNRSSWETVV